MMLRKRRELLLNTEEIVAAVEYHKDWIYDSIKSLLKPEMASPVSRDSHEVVF